MAKQIGPLPIRGTLNNLTYYQLNGKWYVRRKSSLDKKRFMRDAQFENSRRSSKRLAGGSHIGSVIYRECFPGIKSFSKFNQLTGEATKLLKEGYSNEVVLRKMRKKYRPVPVKKVVKGKSKVKSKKSKR